MPYVTSSRLFPAPEYSGTFIRNSDGQRWDYGPSAITPPGSQVTYSYRTNKTNLREGSDYEELSTALLRGSVAHDYQTRFDNGHNFWTSRMANDLSHHRVALDQGSNSFGIVYNGPLWLNVNDSDFYPVDHQPSQSEMNGYGAKALTKLSPTKPEAGLAAFLGELREGLPSVLFAKVRNVNDARSLSKYVGDEHLNIQFGIKPMLNDLTKMAKSVLHFSKITAQYRRDSDKIVRRKMSFPAEETHTQLSDVTGIIRMFTLNGQQVAEEFIVSPGVALNRNDAVSARTWFSGAFTYHLAEVHDFLSKTDEYDQLANKLLGTRITPSVLWEITPWSWLVDWQLHVGEFLSRLEMLSNDSLVWRYGYVMRHTTASRTYSTVGPVIGKFTGQDLGVLSWTFERSSKTRQQTTPYGFGLDLGGFSSRQWAILAALGMSSSPGQLRSD